VAWLFALGPQAKQSEVSKMRPKKRSALIRRSFLMELASHAAMGVAVGLAFAFLVTRIGALEIATFISYNSNPAATLQGFVGACAATFGIGATLTGLVITLTEDHDRADRK
jgi:flagellar motor component MotA